MELWIHDLEKTRPQIQRSGWTRSEVWSHEQPQSNKQTESGTLGEGCCCVWCTEEHRQEQDEGQRGPGLQEQRRDARRASWLWTDSGLDVLDVMTSEDSRIRGHETRASGATHRGRRAVPSYACVSPGLQGLGDALHAHTQTHSEATTDASTRCITRDATEVGIHEMTRHPKMTTSRDHRRRE